MINTYCGLLGPTSNTEQRNFFLWPKLVQDYVGARNKDLILRKFQICLVSVLRLIFSRDLKIGDSGKVELILRFRILIPEQGDIYYTKWMNI